MNSRKGSVSTFQLCSILFLSRIVASFTYMLNLRGPINSGDRPAVMCFFLLFTILFSIPVFVSLGKNTNVGLLKKAAIVSPSFAKLVALGYCAAFLWGAVIAISRFGLFAGTVMFQQTNLLPYILLLLIASVFCAAKGLEPLGRASVLFVTLLVCSLVFVILTLLGRFDALNLTHPLADGLSPVLYESFVSSCRNLELLSLLIVAPRVSGKLRRGFLRQISLFTLCTTVIFTVIGGVTGSYGDNQMFPLYTLAVLAKFSILERMDDLLTGLWVVCALIKIAYFLYVAVLCIEDGFDKKPNIGYYIGAGAVVLGGYLILSDSINTLTTVLRSFVNQGLYVFFAVALPLLVASLCYVCGKIRKKKREGNSA